MKRIAGFIFWLLWMTVFNIITFASAGFLLIFTPLISKKYGWFIRYLVSIWSRIGFILGFCPVTVKGKENMKDEPLVIISNHQSTLDILLLAGFLPQDFIFFSKKEVFYIPFVGQLMKKMGYVSVDRRNPKRAATAIRHAIEKVKDNNRILIFPEGTRSHNPENLLEFKPGSLMVARQGKVPILPVVIYGTSNILPISMPFFMFPGRSVIQIMKPIRPEDPMHPSMAGSISEEDRIIEKLREEMNKVYREIADEMGNKQ
jgi:1-acyl-sn-glycerol-3-phosphate acyltransferase